MVMPDAPVVLLMLNNKPKCAIVSDSPLNPPNPLNTGRLPIPDVPSLVFGDSDSTVGQVGGCCCTPTSGARRRGKHWLTAAPEFCIPRL